MHFDIQTFHNIVGVGTDISLLIIHYEAELKKSRVSSMKRLRLLSLSSILVPLLFSCVDS